MGAKCTSSSTWVRNCKSEDRDLCLRANALRKETLDAAVVVQHAALKQTCKIRTGFLARFSPTSRFDVVSIMGATSKLRFCRRVAGLDHSNFTFVEFGLAFFGVLGLEGDQPMSLGHSPQPAGPVLKLYTAGGGGVRNTAAAVASGGDVCS